MTMQEKQSFDYTKVPHGYVHCFIDSCPRAGECLRRLTARNAPATVETVRCVNPAAVPADKARCPYYRTTRKITLAWGLKHLLDDLPYNTAVSVNRDVRRLWAHTSYQRMARYERPITPELQQKIVRILARKGITTPPRYDYITEEYDFR